MLQYRYPQNPGVYLEWLVPPTIRKVLPMSNSTLTLFASLVAIVATFGWAVLAIWKHKAGVALGLAGIGFTLMHLSFLVTAYKSFSTSMAAGTDLDGWALFPTWVYDASAWLAVAFFAGAAIMTVGHWLRSSFDQHTDKGRLEGIMSEPPLHTGRRA